MTFKQLAIGAEFEFNSVTQFSGLARGPWRKTSARCYVRVWDGLQCKVGSIKTGVTMTRKTLEQWLKQPGPDKFNPIMAHAPRVGVHDVVSVQDARAELWNLSDYFVESVQAGVIWLAPRRDSGMTAETGISCKSGKIAHDVMLTLRSQGIAAREDSALRLVIFPTIPLSNIERAKQLVSEFTKGGK